MPFQKKVGKRLFLLDFPKFLNMKNWVIRNLSLIILIAILAVTVYVGFQYFANVSEKLGVVLGGLFTGLIIAFIQHLISIDEKRKLDLIKALRVKRVLFNRADKEYYRNLIFSAKNRIKVMGVTAIRLLEDFADADSTSMGDKVLIRCLHNSVKVQILLPAKKYLASDSDIQNFETAKTKMEKIKEMFPAYFDFKYFDHVPAHSIFNVDGETIIGPVIPGISSKDTPCIHVENSSPYAGTYLNYFESEWDKANNTKNED